MRYIVLIFISLLVNGCNTENNNILDNKNKVIKEQKEITNNQIIKDKERIRDIIKKYNSEKIKPDNPFKKERDELIERSMEEPVMTKQMRDEYKKEYGYYPLKYEHNTNNKDYSTEVLGVDF